jgi:hypothetical protein
VDVLGLRDDVRMVNRSLSQASDDSTSLVETRCHCQLQGLLIKCTENPHGHGKKNTEDDMEEEGDASDSLLRGVLAIAAEVGVVNPERVGNADDNEELMHVSEVTTNVSRRTLRNYADVKKCPGRNDG